MPVWSGVNIAGVNLKDLNPEIGAENDPENWGEVYKKVVNRYGRDLRNCGIYDYMAAWPINHSLFVLTLAQNKIKYNNENAIKAIAEQTTAEPVCLIPRFLDRGKLL